MASVKNEPVFGMQKFNIKHNMTHNIASDSQVTNLALPNKICHKSLHSSRDDTNTKSMCNTPWK